MDGKVERRGTRKRVAAWKIRTALRTASWRSWANCACRSGLGWRKCKTSKGRPAELGHLRRSTGPPQGALPSSSTITQESNFHPGRLISTFQATLHLMVFIVFLERLASEPCGPDSLKLWQASRELSRSQSVASLPRSQEGLFHYNFIAFFVPDTVIYQDRRHLSTAITRSILCTSSVLSAICVVLNL